MLFYYSKQYFALNLIYIKNRPKYFYFRIYYNLENLKKDSQSSLATLIHLNNFRMKPCVGSTKAIKLNFFFIASYTFKLNFHYIEPQF